MPSSPTHGVTRWLSATFLPSSHTRPRILPPARPSAGTVEPELPKDRGPSIPDAAAAAAAVARTQRRAGTREGGRRDGRRRQTREEEEGGASDGADSEGGADKTAGGGGTALGGALAHVPPRPADEAPLTPRLGERPAGKRRVLRNPLTSNAPIPPPDSCAYFAALRYLP